MEDSYAIEDYFVKATRGAMLVGTDDERAAAREHATATPEEKEGTK